MVDPAVAPVGVPACLSNEIAGEVVTGVWTVLVPVTGSPVGGVLHGVELPSNFVDHPTDSP